MTIFDALKRLFGRTNGRQEVRRHLDVCKACYPGVQFEKHFLAALGRSQTNGRASEELRNRVVQAIAEEGGPGE
jgi:hypothetical protein